MKRIDSHSKIRDLLLKLGFVDSLNLAKFNSLFIKKFQRIEYSSEQKGIRNRKGKIFRYVEVRVKTIYYERCIYMLQKELLLRENATKIQLKSSNFNFISATDIASFTFCKISYAINKSFLIEESFQKFSRFYGTELHKQMKLLFKSNKFAFYDKYNSNFTESQINFLRKINSCELIYSNENNPLQLFSNMTNNYVGKPDYIFKDPKNRHFVVEEKFHLRNSPQKISESNFAKTQDFFLNNILQIKSYLNYIEEYNLQYGILINWYYKIQEQYETEPIIIIDDFTYKIFYKNNSISTDIVMNEIKTFQKEGKCNIETPINLNKCISCSVNMYCGHKTDNFQHVTIPYELKFLKTN